MPSPLRITLRYRGRDVDSGSMDIHEVTEALQGFAGAYGKIASKTDPNNEHQLRVSAVRRGSWEVLIISALSAAGTEVARRIVGTVIDTIRAKKHIRGKPFDVSLSEEKVVVGDRNIVGDGNTVVLLNFEGAKLGVTPELLEIIQSKLIDADLNKIAAPLEPDHIDSAQIIAQGESEEISETITSGEKELFLLESTTTTSKETEIVGVLVSLNKETNRGTFDLNDGNRVRYHYIGDSPERFHADFSHRGPVKALCTAYFDENLKVTHLDVKSVRYLQGEFPFSSESSV
jgi:hypothetical protein